MSDAASSVERFSALTLFTADMRRACAFYDALGLARRSGGPAADFTSYHVGDGYLNLAVTSGLPPPAGWGRAILYVDDVDAFYARLRAAGITPEFAPRDAPWQERYFHVRDPDGHELSFARPIGGSA